MTEYNQASLGNSHDEDCLFESTGHAGDIKSNLEISQDDDFINSHDLDDHQSPSSLKNYGDNGSLASSSLQTQDLKSGSYDSSFSELNNLISKSDGSIDLNSDYGFIKGYDSGGIIISKSITINGNGHTIDASGSANIFNVVADNVVLRNIVLTNAYVCNVNKIGVAISWSGDNGLLDNLTIKNCIFNSTGNAGNYNWWDCGMVYWSGSNGVVNNTRFLSNTVVSSKGVVIWIGSNGTLNNSYFSDCSNTYNPYVGYYEATSFFIYWVGDNGKFFNSIVKNLRLSTRNVPTPYYVSFVNPGHVGNVSFTNCQNYISGQAVYDLNMPFEPIEDYVKDFSGTFNKLTPTIAVPSHIVGYCFLTLSVNSVRSGSVTYSIDNNLRRTVNVDSNGKVNIDISSLNEGNHKITYSYTGNSYYNDVASETSEFTYEIFSTQLSFTGLTSSNGKYNYDFVLNLKKGDDYHNVDSPVTYDIVSYDGRSVTIEGVANSVVNWESSSPLVNLTAIVEGHLVKADYPLKSLQFLIGAAKKGEVVVLSHDYSWVSGIDECNAGNYFFSFNDKTVDGNGYSIDCFSKTTFDEDYQPYSVDAHNWKLFNLGNDAILKNINIKNYTYNRQGYVTGGAIYVSGSNVKLVNVNMSDIANSLNSYSSLNCYGGAIIWNGINGLMEGCNFINCHGGQYGTITVLKDNVVMNNCIIDGSTVYNWIDERLGAAAIRWDGDKGIITNTIIKNSKKNSVSSYGAYMGAVSFTKKPALIENLTMTGNDDYDLQVPFAPVEEYLGENIRLATGFKKIVPSSITLDGKVCSVESVGSGSVTYNIGFEFSKTTSVDENGKFTLDYDFNPSKNYLIKVIYNGNDYYASSYKYFDYSLVGQDSIGSFTDLNNLIQSSSSNIVNLNKDYVYDPVKDSALSGGIIISKSMTINGNDHFIDADYNAVRIFTTVKNVVLNNITFKNSRLASPGNAVLANAQIDISYCTFDNNWAYGKCGGAVKLSANNSNVKYCTFTNNKAMTGAAIVVDSNNNHILHSYFKDNAKDYGGVMDYGSDISGTDGKNAYVNYNVFLDYRPLRHISSEYNRDNWYGINALHDASSPGAPVISNYLKANLNCTFKNNVLSVGIYFTESDSGNVVDVKWANQVIYTISANSIISDTLSKVEYSGVEGNVVVNAVLDNQRLTNQNSKAWYVKTTGNDYNSGTESSPYKTLKKALRSAGKGDIIYVAPGTYAGSGNRGLSISKDISIERWGESGEVIFDGEGYSIFTLNSNALLSSLTFKNGKSDNDGGALVIKSDSVIIDCKFIDNAAASYGGAIVINSGEATIINSVFINNDADSGGGAISTAGVNLNVLNCTFVDNHGGRGGAINSGNAKACLNVDSSTFKDNDADSYGGALAFDGEGSVSGSLFVNNSACLGGGAVYSWGYGHMISYSDFVNNSAADGGAIITLYSNLSSFNNHFDNNLAYGFGGAIYAASGDFIIGDDFSDNGAYYDGGAVYIYNATGAIYQSLFKRNFAGYGGGAIHLLASDMLCSHLGMPGNVSNCENGYTNTLYLNSFIDYGNYALVVADTSNYNGVLPSYFSLVDNGWDTAVKNQGSLSICWDYAVIATVETAIKKATGVEVDLSENNVKNLISMYSMYGHYRDPNVPGDTWEALSYLANSLGPVFETFDKTQSFGFSPLLSNAYHISNIAFATRSRNSPLDNDEVKQAVIKYGGVRANIKMDGAKGYNYYHSTNVPINHAITIVGWDDNYSRSNFPDGCPGDGAWIVKNSWGPDLDKNGYVYVSYYDQTFAWYDLSYIIFNDTIRYSRVYQYDYCMYSMKSSGNSVSWYKNIYNSVKNEGLSAFSTYFDEKTDWEVFVYVEDQLKYTQTGSSQGRGYFTFNFDKIIPVAKGQQFSIALKVNNTYLPCVLKNFNTLPCGEGVSYYSKDGVSWNDLDNENRAACLKVFTQNLPGSLVDIAPIVNVTYDELVIVNFNVENRTNVNYVISKNDKIIAQVNNVIGDSIKLYSLAAGDYSIKITNENNDYYVGSSKSCNFTIFKAESSIVINPISPVTYGNEVNVNFTIDNFTSANYIVKSASGKVIVSNSSIVNINKIILPVLDAGEYMITISNVENENYTGSTAQASFTISKSTPLITIDGSNVIYPNDVVVKLKSDVSGNCTVRVAGQSRNINLKANVESNLVFTGLNAGVYTVYMDWGETVNYNKLSRNTSVVVSKASSSVKINEIGNVSYPDDVIVSYGVINKTNLVVKVKNVNTNEEMIIPDSLISSSSIVLSTLDAGKYLIALNNTGNVNYDGSFDSLEFTVNKNVPVIEVNASSIAYPNDVVVNVKSDVSGEYIIKLANKTKIVNLITGKTQKVIFDKLNASQVGYMLNVTYAETDNYKSLFKDAGKVKVFKASSSVNITNITNGVYNTRIPVVTVEFKNKTTVTYAIYQNNVKISSGSVVEDLLSTLKVGEYSLAISNDGDCNYNSSSDSKIFNILKANSKVNINQIFNKTYNDPVVVNFNIDNKTNVTYAVKTTSGEIVVENTTAHSNSISISNLSSGNYIIIISNALNDCYNEDVGRAEFTVEKAENNVEISVENTLLPNDVLVNVEASVDGIYTIIIGKYKLNVPVKSGRGSAKINLPANDNYIATTTFSDSQNYTVHISEAKFNVSKGCNNVKVEVDSVSYPDNVTIKLTADIAGEYLLDINGTLIPIHVTENNGCVFKNIALPPGNYLAKITNYSSDIYDANITNSKFTVHNGLNNVEVMVNDVKYGEYAIVQVTASVSGDYEIDINGTRIIVNVDEDGATGFNKTPIFKAGKYYANVTSRLDYYTETFKNMEFTVDKAVNNIHVEINTSVYPDVRVKVTADVSGEYEVVLSNGERITVAVNSSKSIKLNAGVYNATVSYSDDNYEANVTNASFEVLGAENMVTVSVDNVRYNQTARVNVTADVDGNYTVKIGDYNVTVNVVDGKGFAYTGVLTKVGKYWANATFENSNYNSTFNNAVFKVDKAVNNIVISIDDVVYPQKVKVYLEAGVEGTYRIFFNDSQYIDVYVDETLRGFNATALNAGNYTATVDYHDENYVANASNCSFEVMKGDANIHIDVSDELAYGEDMSITVTTDVPGKYNVTVGDYCEIVDLANRYSFTSGKLNVGKYVIGVVFLGNDDYNKKEVKKEFKVTLTDPNLIVHAQNVTYGQSVVLCHEIAEDATGHINYTDVNGDLIKRVRIGESFNMTGLNAGNYTVLAKYSGDLNYNPVQYSISINVKKAINRIKLKAMSVEYPLNVTISLTSDVFGNYTVLLNDGEEFVLPCNSSKSIKLNSGEYVAGVKYADGNYESEITNCSFEVSKADNDVLIEIDDVSYLQQAIVHVNADVDGNYTVVLSNGENIIVEVVNGKGYELTAPLNTSGVIYASTSFDDAINYNVNVTNDSFEVKKAINNIKVDVDSLAYPGNVTIKVIADVLDNYTVDINGTLIVIDGNAFNTINLPAGAYFAKIVDYSSKYYEGVYDDAAFVVDRGVNAISVVVGNSSYCYGDEIAVTVLADVKGNYSLILDEFHSLTVPVFTNFEGKFAGSIKLPWSLEPNHYVLSANWSNPNYVCEVEKGVFDIVKADNHISVEIDSLNYPNNVTVKVAADIGGIYAVDINGTIVEVEVNDDGVGFNTVSLNPGNYYACVLYSSDNYNGLINNASFEVFHGDIGSLKVIVDDADYLTSIIVTVSSSVDGDYIVCLNDENYTVNVLNGVGSLDVGLLDCGKYDVAVISNIVNYGVVSNSTSFEVRKVNPVFKDIPEIEFAYGQVGEVSLAGNASAYVIGYQEAIVSIENNALFISNLNAGQYVLNVTFIGDRNHNDVSKLVNVTVDREYSDLQSDNVSVKYLNQPVVLNVSCKNAIGLVGHIYDIGDNLIYNFTSSLNDKVLLPKFNVGNYSIVLSTIVDSNHIPVSKAYMINVAQDKINPARNITLPDIAPNKITKLPIKFDDGATGHVNLTIDEQFITSVDLINSSAMLIIPRLLAGTHEIKISYSGDENYNPFNQSMTVEISKITPVINKTVEYANGELKINMTIWVNGETLSNQNISVIINNETHTAEIVNNTALIRISDLKDIHEGIIKYDGNDFTESITNNFTFKIPNNPVKMENGKNIKVFYLQPNKYSIRIVDFQGNAVNGVNVQFKLNNKLYKTVLSDADGYASLTLNLPPGKYTIEASIYDNVLTDKITIKHILNAKKTVIVKKSKKKTLIKITLKGHKVKQVAKVKFTYKGKNKIKVKFAKTMKKQKVSVKFKGKAYKVKVNGKGKGILKLTKKASKKLKKGKKYTTKVTYAGSKLYKKAKVTVKFNGKKYVVKTNKKGIAKFKITKKMVKKLKKGKKIKYTIFYKNDKLNRFVKIM